MKSILIILVVLALIGLSSCANTHCGLWGKDAWRCAKDNAPDDWIRVSTTCSGCNVKFMVGTWHSQCHKKGSNDKTESGEAGESGIDFDFPAAAKGKLINGLLQYLFHKAQKVCP